MKFPRPLLASFAGMCLGIAFSACDSQQAATGPTGSDTRGSLAFALTAAVRAQVDTTADSLKVELHLGNVACSSKVALDDTIHMSDLDEGRWKIKVSVYNAGGSLLFFGEDSVDIRSHRTTVPDVQVTEVYYFGGILATDSLLGQWYLLEVDTTTIFDRSIPLNFGDTNHLYGSDGCNTINGAYFATSTTLHIPGLFSTEMNCIDSRYPNLNGQVGSALRSIRTWKITSGVLSLSDSTGVVLLRYGRNPPDLPGTPTVSTDSMVNVEGKDTTGKLLLAPGTSLN